MFVNLWAGRIGAPMTYAAVHQLVGRIRARTGVEFTLHMLRHTHATELIRSGVAIEVVARLLTHQSSTTTSQIYVHLDVADVRAALQRAGVWAEGRLVTSSGAARHLRPRPEVLAGGGDRSRPSTPTTPGTPRGSGSRPAAAATSPTSRCIDQVWLREAIKRWSRFRLGAGYTFTTIDAGAQALARWSLFLAERPEVAGPADITRELLQSFLSWMASSHWAINTRSHTLTFTKVFLEWGHRHDTLPGLPADAVIYEEEVSRPPDALPQFIPEFVMAQLECRRQPGPAAQPDRPPSRRVVDGDRHPRRRRVGARVQPDRRTTASAALPALRQLQGRASNSSSPSAPRPPTTIRAQQDHVRSRWPQGSPWLFPGILENADGTKPYAHGSLSHQLGNWQKAIDVRDEAGQPVRVHAHQFRHTVGTRLINAGVPQHVIQRLLGHASPRMTARYAQIHDHTVRDAFERYCAQRVNTAGDAVPYDPDALTADAEWVKHNLSRVRDSLPNGYCGRPPQQDCPHPNACLTCPDFQTTPEFLDVHRHQATTNRKLIARADSNGQFRLADNLRRVQDSLDRIIPALEDLDGDKP